MRKHVCMRPGRKILFVLVAALPLLLAAACTGGKSGMPADERILHIAAAANLGYVMPKLIDGFREERKEFAKTDIRVTKASSGSLTAQIRNGAPYGLFLSADSRYPEALCADGLALGKPVVYARGVPVMVYREGTGCKKGVVCLAGKRVGKVAVPRPELAPYGEAALDILGRAGILEAVEGKFVYGASVTQTFQHAITAADAGFVAKSLLFGEGRGALEKAGRQWSTFPSDAYDARKLRQAMVLLEGSGEVAGAFFAYMQGRKARDILENNGYRVE